MCSITLPLPVAPLSPKNFNPSLSSHSHHRYYPLRSRSATVPPGVTLRDDGTLLARESLEPLPPELVAELMPHHVAVIMDGHGRWAKRRGFAATEGHRAGVGSLKRVVRLCCSWGIEVLTVFACSTENLTRPKVFRVFSFHLHACTFVT